MMSGTHPDNYSSSEGTELVNIIKESSVSVDTKKDLGHSGLLKIDVICADAEVRYPTDLDLIHDSVEIMDRISRKNIHNGISCKANDLCQGITF